MKPEFAKVLIPPVKIMSDPNSRSAPGHFFKWMSICAVLFALTVTIITTGLIILRYEDKFNRYEERLQQLEQVFKFDEGPLDPDNIHEYDMDLWPMMEEVDEELDEEDKLKRYEEHFGELRLKEEETTKQPEIIEEPVTLSRSKRQIPQTTQPYIDPRAPRTVDGVPILSESYLDRIQVTIPPRRSDGYQPVTDSEGLRLYEGLWATGGVNEPKHPDFVDTTRIDSIQPHHRQSAAWSEKDENQTRRQLKSGDTASTSTGPRFADDNIYTRSQSQYTPTRSQIRPSSPSATGAGSSAVYGSSGSTSSQLASSGSGGTYHRSSRVPSTGDYLHTSENSRHRRYQYPPLKRLGQGDGEVVARVLQSDTEANADEPHKATAAANHGDTATAFAESYRRRVNGHGIRRNPAPRKPTLQTRKPYLAHSTESEEDGTTIVKAEAWAEGPRTIAAHIIADVSNYTLSHRHYEGNGRLRNAEGIFSAWKFSSWMGPDKTFSLSPNGVLTVKTGGLYYIYAQIHYLDEHDINGYIVQVNTEPFLQCTTMTETYNGGSKSNSCYTAGVTVLKEGDRIVLKDVEKNRYSIFKPEKSFFGLMRLGDAVK